MKARKYTEKDITYVLTVRLSEYTPWILERIKFQLSYYDPRPEFLILDFGSEEKYSKLIEAECSVPNTQYIKLNDNDTFSASKAKNHAYHHVNTDLLLFSDVDCIFDKDIFQKLAKDATLLELENNPKNYITFPVTHLEQKISDQFQKLEEFEQEKLLKQLDYHANKACFKDEVEFIAPYSNILFMHRKLYDLSGGYCDIFRGHGSEDFEYLIRLGYLTSDIPKPRNLNKDFYGPLKNSFWADTTYEGFRKYLEALTFASETMGYRTYHLWHPKPSEKGYWTNKNDWKRERFNTILGIYLQKEEKVLEVDYHKRDKNALCLMNDPEQWGYFLPLRTLGYSLKVASRNNQAEIDSAYRDIQDKAYDLVCIFNPYMKSHKNYYDLIELCKTEGIPVKIIERGALPQTVYYAEEVAYNDNDYYQENLISKNILKRKLTPDQFKDIESYIGKLCKGEHTLEAMQDYKVSINYLKEVIDSQAISIFVPLQLADDMAVNYFTENHQPYNQFVTDILSATEMHPSVNFYIKPHPLMPNIEIFNDLPNVTVLSDLNIHAILDTFNHIIVYNSGVGLLSILHGKKPYSIGNAFYSLNGRLTTKVKNFQQSIDIIINTLISPTLDQSEVYQFLDWLYNTKYSLFSAKDHVRDFGHRLSHGYKNIQIQRFNFDEHVRVLNSNHIFAYSEKSYIAAKMRINARKKPEPQPITPPKEEDIFHKNQRKLRKLLNNPKNFWKDALNKRLNYIKAKYIE